MLLDILTTIPDHRSRHGRRYDLAHLLLFSILALVSGADSYRTIHAFIKTHFTTLKDHFHMCWRTPPSYNAIRRAILGTDAGALERAFRMHASELSVAEHHRHLSLDGKTVRGSFDHFHDQKAVQVFNALLNNRIILAHETIEGNKTNEIPVAQKLLEELGLSGCMITADAMHCQKKRWKY
jgi:hypothetical protein